MVYKMIQKRVIHTAAIFFFTLLAFSQSSPAMEPMSAKDMSGIVGQATATPSNESRETIYTTPTEVAPGTDILQVPLPRPEMVPSIVAEEKNKTVLIDFLPSETAPQYDVFDTYDFQGSVDVGNIIYTDNDTNTSIILDGIFTGYFLVPSTFEDGESTHTLTFTNSNFPDDVKERFQDGKTDIHFGYQGTVYSAGSVIGLADKEKLELTARPNRQAQLVGRAPYDKDLDILHPVGHGESTQWKLLTTISAGEAFIKIDINRLVNHHKAKYTIKLANNEKGLNAGDPGSQPSDYSGTLGTLYMGGEGKTTIEPGTIVITTIKDAI